MTTLPKPYQASGRAARHGHCMERSSIVENSIETALLAEALDLHRQGRLVDARSGYQRILSRWPDHSDALNLMGALEQAAGNLEIALGHLEKAVALVPSSEIYLNNLGNALKETGEFLRAEDCYHRAADLDPSNPNPCYNLAVLLQDQDRLDEARIWYEKALILAPHDPAILNNCHMLRP